ncbi:MAG TPA: hypothetical protein VMU05_15095 [Dongiaceae bacterium]|nr:hypothetical protein [Dongiaceae bacterium]
MSTAVPEPAGKLRTAFGHSVTSSLPVYRQIPEQWALPVAIEAVTTLISGPALAVIHAEGCKAMTYIPYIPNDRGLIGIEDSRRILLEVFPKYPELKPCNPVPRLEPIAQSDHSGVRS